jgi:hypothetical protein
MFDFLLLDLVLASIVGLIPLVLGITKNKRKLGFMGFGACVITGTLGTILFAIPISIIFIWLIVRKVIIINKSIYDSSNKSIGDKTILFGIAIPALLSISGVVSNAIGGYASFYIFIGTPIFILIVGSYVFNKINKKNGRYEVRSNFGIVMVSAMISFIVCCALVLVFIQIHLINTMDIIRFLIVATSSLIFSILDIVVILFIILGIKPHK